MDEISDTSEYYFLRGAGEMGTLIQNHNWPESSLGTISRWPQSLCNTLGNLLHSAFPMFLYWGDDLVCFYNDAYRPSLGQDGKHPAIGKKGPEVWSEIWEFVGPLISNVYQSGKPEWFENALIPIYRNGRMEDVYWTFSFSPAYGDDQKIAGVLVTCIETTQAVLSRKVIEETVAQRTQQLEQTHHSLIHANNYLQDIINSLKSPLQVLEPVWQEGVIVDFRFKITNAAYASYANTTPEELQNKRVSEFFPGYFHTTSFTNTVKVFVSGVQETWQIHYDQDGLDLYNEMTAIKMGDEVILHFTDFTTLKYLELELLKKIKELENSNQNLEEFARAASHDLKEPIRKVQIFNDRLKAHLNGGLTEEALVLFNKIENASKRMALLIDDLLLYSHLSLIPLEKETLDLNKKVNQVMEDLELFIQEKKAIFTIHDLPTVKGYKRQLLQLFQNLISNALKYSLPGVPPHIVISAGSTSENGKRYHLIEVSDNGIGFEKENAEKIFQLFTRLHGNGSAYAGTGIGLSIVKKVVDNHKGIIKAEGTPGKGATFKILLPVE